VIPRTTTVYLTWNDNSINEEKFRVRRTVIITRSHSYFAQLFGTVTKLAAIIADNLPINSTTHSDNATEDTTYEYQIDACNAIDCTASNPVQVYVPIPAPGDFTAGGSCDPTAQLISLDWSPGAGTTPGGGPVTYNAYWSISSMGPFNVLPATCSPNINGTTCVATLPQTGTLYYRVIAQNNGGTTPSDTGPVICAPPETREVIPR
jgi:hypothetical protein